MKISPDDLVLHVSETVDPTKIDLIKYDDFLDELCGDRVFQKEAIKTVVRYLLGGRYKSTQDLARENFENNEKLQDFYKTLSSFIDKLEFKNKLSCTVDLATATGKSYVMFGVAQILLCEGAVDQVLVLCPSITIERGLTEKFKELAGEKFLRVTLPQDSIIKNPRIVNASVTIQRGDICIENYHAILKHVSSSVDYSLEGRGARTLMLNDEAHHIMNPKVEVSTTDKIGMKKWKEFIVNPKFGFRYVVNSTGTPYIGNNYFTDVVYRYAILNAMEDRWTKKIKYVDEEEARNWQEKIQEIYDNHQDNKKKYRKYKPITIFVTQRISYAEELAEDIKKFLMKKEKLAKKQADKKVIVVTSSSKHKKNVEMLDEVDDKKNPIEWISSVSMLTEGWDVKGVFQIVPHEKRAFNSKLLIAQVLGRGLRIPDGCDYQPILTVFNHERWRDDVRNLVYEVMGYEERVRSYVVEKDKDYNFPLYNIDYEPVEKVVKQEGIGKAVAVPKIIKLATQDKVVKRHARYYVTVDDRVEKRTYDVEVPIYSMKKVANDIYNKLYWDAREDRVNYLKGLSRSKIEKIIRDSLKQAGDKLGVLTVENKQRVERAFDSLKKKTAKVVKVEYKSRAPYEISTTKMPASSTSLVELKKTKYLIYNEDSARRSKEDYWKMIEKAVYEELPPKRTIRVKNNFDYKCPLNVAILSHNNERDFGEYLVNPEYSHHIDAWIKSVDRGFYTIPYTYRKWGPLDRQYGVRGSKQKEASFNPDFFIKIRKDVLAVEIKSDEDITVVNKAKLKHARQHFDKINKKQKKQRYYFKFLSPQDYSAFFESIKKGTYRSYNSNLEVDLVGS